MRKISPIAAVTLGLICLIWAVGKWFGPMFAHPEQARSAPPMRENAGRLICRRDGEIGNGLEKICIYYCEDGEKTRVDTRNVCNEKVLY